MRHRLILILAFLAILAGIIQGLPTACHATHDAIFYR
jgi:hypothetical protein